MRAHVLNREFNEYITPPSMQTRTTLQFKSERRCRPKSQLQPPVSNNRTIIVVLSFNYRDMKQSLASNQQQKWTGEKLVLVCSLLLMGSSPVQAWGSSHQSTDELVYGNRFDNDWLNGGSTLSFHVDGCAWGYTYDSEEAGCLEDESEEGTTNWYMMANCRRPQVAFSVYKGNSCSSGNFVGSVGFLLMLQCGSPAFLRSNHCV